MQPKNITTQKLAVSQKTVTASTVLQCSTDELYAFLEQQALDNPVIDMDSQTVRRSSSDEFKISQRRFSDEKAAGGAKYDEQDLPNSLWDMQFKQELDLSQYLLFQLLPLHLTSVQTKIANYIVNSLNKDGFWDINVEEAASACAVDITEIYEVLEFLWTLDPPGVCAYDVRHCLCIQVDRLNADPLAKTIINKHLSDVAKDKVSYVAKELKQPSKRVRACFELIKTLDPHPCKAFIKYDEASYIYPDITVTLSDSGIVYSVSEYLSPKIYISNYYLELRKNSHDEQLNAYLDERINKIRYLQQCIQNRQSTIEQVAKIITGHQQDFFIYGSGHLKPITMAEAAKKLGVHESTVSRALRGKYLLCSHGMFPLSHFFPGAANSGDDIPVSRDLITALIKKLISNENKSHPLNDRIIAELLEDRGINISRRTVAKYREAAGIASSSERCVKIK